MITINSHNVPSSTTANSKEKAALALQKEALLYKIACLCYTVVVIVLLTFFIIRAFKFKYHPEEECYTTTWIDTIITFLTLTIILLGSGLLIASLKYVFEINTPIEPDPVPVNKIEDFVRRNSQCPTGTTVCRNPSINSNSWLTAVRTEAYESHRRMSTVANPAHKSTKLALPNQKE